MLSIKNLHVSVQDSPILKGVNLEVGPDEVHVIMGPNGSGKSTLGYTLAGKPDYEVTSGSIEFEGNDILEMEPDERVAAGMFLAFQYPVEIAGVNNSYFLRTALNMTRKAQGLPEVDGITFLKDVRNSLKQLKMDQSFLKRGVNEGFSGGEKKRNEIVQMSILQPKLAVLDETDSGLDIDALRVVAEGINQLRDGERSFVIITHYQRLLEYLEPDRVHVLSEGRIVQSGGPELALELESNGYGYLEDASE
jgi:Fe-S cluster assembly ATP-binding protein